MARVAPILIVLLVVAGCGGADRATRKNMVEWAEVLQVHIATSFENKFPERLGDVDPEFRAHLSRTDGWGKEMLYKRLREDIYHLISAGPDGQFGNEDDIVSVRGHFQDAMEVYGSRPLSAAEKSL